MFLPFDDDNPTRRVPIVTYTIIAVNVVIFFWISRLTHGQREWVTLHRGFVPARVSQLFNPRPIAIPRQVLVQHPFFGRAILQGQVVMPPDRGEILLSFLTSQFLHGSWLHVIMNMWYLALFGKNVEDRLGRGVFLLFYLVGGVLAAACHWAIEPNSITPVIGASGAVAAVLGGYAIAWPWARVHTLIFLIVFITIIDVPALVLLGIWFLMQLMEAHGQLNLHLAGGVAWWAHVGGFLAGMAMMPLLSWMLHAEGPPSNPPAEEKAPSDDAR
ncbi:MAG: rhomboid family intramembrane serine protease [Pirellulales bacterium]|nr:rhomboid family intramembrane serine protease [Pirellulales bacterium]